ncbi:MAG: exodeoxyribonuclease V subunit alpha, partial [Balneolaceae bacterium]
MSDKPAKLSNWVYQGVESGWISQYERELLDFLITEYGELPKSVETAVVFGSLFLQAGHVCLPLDQSPEQWIQQLDMDTGGFKSDRIPDLNVNEIFGFPPVGLSSENDHCLFVVEENRFFIKRYWYYEHYVAQKVKELSSIKIEIESVLNAREFLNQLFVHEEGEEEINYQKAAAALSLAKRFLLISGGPGTGKTTTVARILALILQTTDLPFRIALAAPTGKAAARMAEALQEELNHIHLAPELLEQIPDKAQTLHRLLLPVEHRGLLPAAEAKKLPYDLIILDEASMVDLTLMYRLVSHMEKNTRVIMMGDKDQLSSVEAGSVLADICRNGENRFTPDTVSYLNKMGIPHPESTGDPSQVEDSIVYLTKNYRFDPDSGIALLAKAVKGSSTNVEIEEILYSPSYPDLEFQPFKYTTEGIQHIFDERVHDLNRSRGKTPEQMLRIGSESVWLSVLRSGPFGADALNYMIEENLIRNKIIQPRQGWYDGRPVMITRNDYRLGVYNGDLGVCTMTDDRVPW